jgi:hypothetical protein
MTHFIFPKDGLKEKQFVLFFKLRAVRRTGQYLALMSSHRAMGNVSGSPHALYEVQ